MQVWVPIEIHAFWVLQMESLSGNSVTPGVIFFSYKKKPWAGDGAGILLRTCKVQRGNGFDLCRYEVYCKLHQNGDSSEQNSSLDIAK